MDESFFAESFKGNKRKVILIGKSLAKVENPERGESKWNAAVSVMSKSVYRIETVVL